MTELANLGSSSLVPAAFAEKAMASLMQLHTELVDEKERRVDLFRRLMEREQALAELRMYVKVLEEKLAPQKAEAAVPAPTVVPPPEPVRVEPPRVEPRVEQPRARVAPVPPSIGPRRHEGWRAW